MIGFLFFILLFTLLVLIILIPFFPMKCKHDLKSPLNFVLFQEPNKKYTNDLVNKWVNKAWRHDGQRIPCHIEKGYDDNVPLKDRKLVIYSHGNGDDLLSCIELMRIVSSTLHIDAVCYDYSGYGLNEPDTFERTRDGLNLTLKTVVEDHTRDGYLTEHIILWGYSLGTGPSIWMASEMCKNNNPPASLVLFGAFSSIKNVIKDITNKFISDLFEERWNNEENIKNINIPILITHGQNDTIIKLDHAQKLKQTNEKARLVILPNTGHVINSWTDYINLVKEWLTDNQIL
jgi:predicted esterase